MPAPPSLIPLPSDCPGTVETARSGPPRYDMHIQLPRGGADAQRVYGLSAFRHQDVAEDGGSASLPPLLPSTTHY